MKSMFSLFLLSGSLILSSCSSDKANEGQSGMAAAQHEQHLADETARKELTEVYKEYLGVKDALVKSDAATAKTNASELLNELTFDMSALTAEERAEWEKQMQAMKTAAGDIVATGDIEKQREAFASLSSAMEAATHAIGLQGATVYRQHCPMALNDQGASWLAGEDEVNNPYFGDKMLHCGAVEDTLNF